MIFDFGLKNTLDSIENLSNLDLEELKKSHIKDIILERYIHCIIPMPLMLIATISKIHYLLLIKKKKKKQYFLKTILFIFAILFLVSKKKLSFIHVKNLIFVFIIVSS